MNQKPDRLLWQILFFCFQALVFADGLRASYGDIQEPVRFGVFQECRDKICALGVKFTLADGFYIYGPHESVGQKTSLQTSAPILSLQYAQALTSAYPDGKISHKLGQDAWVVAFYAETDPKRVWRLSYQPCTTEFCSLEQKKEIIEASAQSGLNPEVFSGLVWPEGSSIQPASEAKTETFTKTSGLASADDEVDKLVESGFWLALLQAFLFGLLASLTPCVYPMIPITVSLFASEDTGRARRFLRALAYVMGIVLSYALLGVIAARTGQDLGAWLAKPVVVVPLALIMLAMALSLFGLFELDLPQSLKQKLATMEGEGFLRLFVMGGVMGFVAAPCVGPFAAALMVWIVKNPGSLMYGFSLMASFGLGLGVLFLVLAMGAGSFLPRSGNWMIILKKVMGFLLLGVAFYFIKIFLSDAVIDCATGLYLIASGALMGAFHTTSFQDSVGRILSKGFGLAVFIFGLFYVASSGILPGLKFGSFQSAEAKATTIEVFDDHDKALQYAREKKLPTFIYFGAKWCIPCHYIKDKVLPDRQVQAELARFAVAMLDCTDGNSKAAKIKSQQYKSPAMPYFVFYDSKGVQRSDLTVQGKLDIPELLSILKKL